jgi:hypothetical protein
MPALRRSLTLVVFIAAGCSAPAASSAPAPVTPAPTSASTTGVSTPAPTSAAGTPVATPATAGPPITIDEGRVVIDAASLAPLVFVPPQAGSADPFFHVHTSPASDGFFLGIELYTVYGTAWTGQTGTFSIDCRPAGTGICVHFDPDGPGPQPNVGADFKATGDITIDQLDPSGFDVTLSNVAFSDGTGIAGPLRLRSS